VRGLPPLVFLCGKISVYGAINPLFLTAESAEARGSPSRSPFLFTFEVRGLPRLGVLCDLGG